MSASVTFDPAFHRSLGCPRETFGPSQESLPLRFTAVLTYGCSVRYPAIDSIPAVLEIYVLEDAFRAIDLNGSVAATNLDFRQAGVGGTLSSELPTQRPF